MYLVANNSAQIFFVPLHHPAYASLTQNMNASIVDQFFVGMLEAQYSTKAGFQQ